jgi:hypothetical protein
MTTVPAFGRKIAARETLKVVEDDAEIGEHSISAFSIPANGPETRQVAFLSERSPGAVKHSFVVAVEENGSAQLSKRVVLLAFMLGEA